MEGSGRRWPRAELRAGDADRQAVVAELQRHFVDGRLSSDELGDRVAQALSARTFGELAAPLEDLPALGDGRPAEVPVPRPRGWESHLMSPPLGAALVLIGLLAMLWLFVFPSGHFGVLPFWPILIWGFFFIGRPHRGGPRRF